MLCVDRRIEMVGNGLVQSCSGLFCGLGWRLWDMFGGLEPTKTPRLLENATIQAQTYKPMIQDSRLSLMDFYPIILL